MFLIYEEACYSDSTVGVLEHGDLAEMLAVLAMKPFQHYSVVATAEHLTTRPNYAPMSFALLVGGYLHPARGGGELFETLPIGLLRAAVEAEVSGLEAMADSYGAQHKAAAQVLREALFLREQKDRIAADLADMERIAAMPVDDATSLPAA